MPGTYDPSRETRRTRRTVVLSTGEAATLSGSVVQGFAAMRMFVLGAAYAGKTTLCEHLRRAYRLTALDTNDEMVRLRRRHAIRLAQAGWTNVRWLEWDQDHSNALRQDDHFDHFIPAERDVAVVAAEIVALGT